MGANPFPLDLDGSDHGVAAKLIGSSETSITAFAGGGQANGRLLNATLSRVTTVASAGDSVKLPVAKAGCFMLVQNSAAANSMNVFPNTGDAIAAGAANAAFAVAAGKSAYFFCAANGFWGAVLSA
jgi:hypothetical protein